MFQLHVNDGTTTATGVTPCRTGLDSHTCGHNSRRVNDEHDTTQMTRIDCRRAAPVYLRQLGDNPRHDHADAHQVRLCDDPRDTLAKASATAAQQQRGDTRYTKPARIRAHPPPC